MQAKALWYVAPGRSELREEAVAEPAAGEVRVRALYGAISRGTERLVCHGMVPPAPTPLEPNETEGQTTAEETSRRAALHACREFRLRHEAFEGHLLVAHDGQQLALGRRSRDRTRDLAERDPSRLAVQLQ